MKVYILLEAVDPEERKLRLRKISHYASRKKAGARLAADYVRKWDTKHGGGVTTSSHGPGFGGYQDGNPGFKAKQAKNDMYSKALRARAILQKHTGKDYQVNAYDSTGGKRKPLHKQRPSKQRKQQAVKVLRADKIHRNIERVGGMGSLRKIDRVAGRMAGRWAKRRLSK